MDSGVEFVAVDNPHATKFTIRILAVVAQHEAEMISERTKAALAAAKARGVRLGKGLGLVVRQVSACGWRDAEYGPWKRLGMAHHAHAEVGELGGIK
jgi:DNA invertase Pin-like site-specific DNA recombinase